jgi:NAD(P)-dependent dehydrogenase (short-subunit alcohol dehydrogenase family)
MDTSALFRVDGMVAVVTGGGTGKQPVTFPSFYLIQGNISHCLLTPAQNTTGIGYNMALGLASAGAKKVYILGRRKAVLEEAAKAHPSLHPVECDVGSKASLQAAVDAVSKDSGGYVNLVIANSGITGPSVRWDDPSTMTVPGAEGNANASANARASLSEQRKRLFEEVDMDKFTEAFHINVTGAYFTMLAFMELLDAGNANAMKGGFGAPIAPKKGRGEVPVPSIQSQVIFTSSISAYSRACVSAPAYTGSKAAIAHLMKHASTNLASYGIRANALAPGSE